MKLRFQEQKIPCFASGVTENFIENTDPVWFWSNSLKMPGHYLSQAVQTSLRIPEHFSIALKGKDVLLRSQSMQADAENGQPCGQGEMG